MEPAGDACASLAFHERPQRERDIQAAILARLGSRPDTRLWRQQAGRFFHVAHPCARCRDSGYWIQAAPTGSSDLVGLHMGRFLGVEVKGPTGRQSREQAAFQRMVERQGGIYILARSVEEAERAL